MAEFQPITFNTQEEYDNAFKDRVARAEKKFEGYTSPDDLRKIQADYQKQIDDLTKSINDQSAKYKDFDKKLAEKDSKIAKYESDSAKTRLAVQYNIPFELADKISGSTPEEMEKDAKKLATYFTQQPAKKGAPAFKPNESEADGVTKRFMELNPNLKL